MPAPKYLPHYTLADYQQWDGDWELWDGVAVSMSPSPFGRHQKFLGRLSQRIWNALDAQGGRDCEVLLECDWILSQDNVVRPDLAIICGTTTERHIETAPTLIVEILSDSTRHKDQTAKRDRYQAEGVPHYILSDPADQSTVRLQLNPQQTYEDCTSSGDPYQLHPNCQLPANTFHW